MEMCPLDLTFLIISVIFVTNLMSCSLITRSHTLIVILTNFTRVWLAGAVVHKVTGCKHPCPTPAVFSRLSFQLLLSSCFFGVGFWRVGSCQGCVGGNGMYGASALWKGSRSRGKSAPLGTQSQGLGAFRLVDSVRTAYKAWGQRTEFDNWAFGPSCQLDVAGFSYSGCNLCQKLTLSQSVYGSGLFHVCSSSSS